MSRCSACARIGIVATLLLPCLTLGAPFDYIQNKNTNRVSVIDTANGAVVATQTNAGFVVNLAGTRIYLVTSRKVSVIDTTTGASIADVLPSSGNGITVNAAGTRIDAAKEVLSSVSVIDQATNTIVSEVIVASPSSITGVAVNPTGTRVYIADGVGNVFITLDSPPNIAPPIVGVEGTPYAIVQSIDPDSGAGGPDFNQHGLTGGWYEPETSGQGFIVEVFPNPSGNGQAFVSWTTFDSVRGGAERQRWYTLQGPVIPGQPNASLTIYQNVGGSFNAPPATNAQEVGTATLSFATCSTGNLSYSFTDGTNRAGTIPLTRLLPNVTCSVASPHPADADFALSGSWYGGAATSGQGFMAEVAPEARAFFLSWFTYKPNGVGAGAAAQRWYTAQGAFTPGARTIPLQIYQTTGGMFDRQPPAGQRTVPVGSGSMVFLSCSAATFTYDFSDGTSMGTSGTIPLVRVGPVPAGCVD